MPSIEKTYPFKDVKLPEKEGEKFPIERVDAEDLSGIIEQLRLEMKHGYTPHEEDWPEQTAPERQRLIRDGKMILSVVRKQGEIVAFVQTEMAPGVHGREMKEDEAGTAALVRPDLQNSRIADRMLADHEQIAREAGKTAIRTPVWNHNYGSMRLAMRRGYRLIGEGKYKDKDPARPDSIYRKNLETTPPIAERTSKEIQEHLNAERKAGRLPVTAEINDTSPDQVLIDPKNTNLMNQALEHGYVGVYLLSPKDVTDDPEIDKNFVVFVKAENLPENQ